MDLTQISRSLIRLHVLLEASRRPLDGVSVVAALRDRGVALNAAAARRILGRFEQRGFLASTGVRSSRVRRVYRITTAGRRQVREARRKVGALMRTL